MTDFLGTSGNDDFTGSSDADAFDMTQGGDDIVRGLGGDLEAGYQPGEDLVIRLVNAEHLGNLSASDFFTI